MGVLRAYEHHYIIPVDGWQVTNLHFIACAAASVETRFDRIVRRSTTLFDPRSRRRRRPLQLFRYIYFSSSRCASMPYNHTTRPIVQETNSLPTYSRRLRNSQFRKDMERLVRECIVPCNDRERERERERERDYSRPIHVVGWSTIN